MNPVIQATTAIDCDNPQITQLCCEQDYSPKLMVWEQTCEQGGVEEWGKSFGEQIVRNFLLDIFQVFCYIASTEVRQYNG